MPRNCARSEQGILPQPPSIPYGRQCLDEHDIEAVVAALRSAWLTTGPRVEQFEAALAQVAGTRFAVAVSSGTAALHAAMFALKIGPGDEVIVPPMTFAATANAVVFQGGTPVFADVDPDTLLLDPAAVEAKISPRTKAVIAVDYAGQSCDYDALRTITDRHGLALLDDACHALGGSYQNRPVGSLADLNIFSFHPVKHITTGEGGAITTDDEHLAARMRLFRNHGITTDFRQRERAGSWHYDMVELGYNYRISDIQCALGISQLGKLSAFVARRREIASRYEAAFSKQIGISPLAHRNDNAHAYHLYVVRVEPGTAAGGRSAVFQALRSTGIGVNVHYIPVHLHPYYQERFGCHPGDCPVAEAVYEQILSLPMFAALSDAEVERVIVAVGEAIQPSAPSSAG